MKSLWIPGCASVSSKTIEGHRFKGEKCDFYDMFKKAHFGLYEHEKVSQGHNFGDRYQAPFMRDGGSLVICIYKGV